MSRRHFEGTRAADHEYHDEQQVAAEHAGNQCRGDGGRGKGLDAVRPPHATGGGVTGGFAGGRLEASSQPEAGNRSPFLQGRGQRQLFRRRLLSR